MREELDIRIPWHRKTMRRKDARHISMYVAPEEWEDDERTIG